MTYSLKQGFSVFLHDATLETNSISISLKINWLNIAEIRS